MKSSYAAGESTRSGARIGPLAAFLGFAAFALGLKELLEPWFWRYCGPVSLIAVMVCVAMYMRRNDISWRAIGFVPRRGIGPVLLLIPQTLVAIAAIVGTGVAVGTAGEALGIGFMSDLDAASAGVNARWGDIEGNAARYALWMAIAWISGGFAEEAFFRGFLITRLLAAFPASRFRWAIAIVLPAIVFGYGHVYYQGPRGFVMTGSIGLSLGVLFLVYRRNLWPLIAAHGIVDSLAFTAIFLKLDI